jgi:hypothetical protein
LLRRGNGFRSPASRRGITVSPDRPGTTSDPGPVLIVSYEESLHT